MLRKIQHNPIFITGVERSGSTIIARILDLCNVSSGNCNNMFENVIINEFNTDYLKNFSLTFPKTADIDIPIRWKGAVDGALLVENCLDKPYMVKSAMLARLWPIWNYAYPDAKWLIVRRRTGDVIQSCLKTGYMKTFKSAENLLSLGLTKEAEGWLWWIHQYENKFVEMIKAGLNCRIIWPERMVTGNYEQMYETIEWLGLKWNEQIPEIIDPLLSKSREGIIYENNSR